MTRPMSALVWRHQDAMLEMIERLEVDAVALAHLDEGAEVQRAMARCLACPCPAECRAWLDGEVQARDPLAYCPNVALFLDWTRN